MSTPTSAPPSSAPSAPWPSANVCQHGTLNGKTAQLFQLVNNQGTRIEISELGAHLLSVTTAGPDREPIEWTLGYASFEDWCENAFYLGSTVGRFGNRIAHGEFTLNDHRYTLATNNEPQGIPCHLHGGPDGFHRKIWKGLLLSEASRQGVELTLTSPDGEEGYPGKLEVKVTYWLDDDNRISWQASATTDQPTPVNIINHSYWNLSGDMDSDIGDHLIQIHADQFLPTNPGMIPTGEIRSVLDSPMDFKQPQKIGERIDSHYEPLQTGSGYDHCWVLNKTAAREKSDHEESEMHLAAVVNHPDSGRRLEVFTNQPGLQFYTGNFLDGSANGMNRHSYPRRSGFCLETQAFPDAPNHPNFPSCILLPGETYLHQIVYRLS